MDTMIAPPTMGSKIRAARRRRGFTQGELADKSRCSRQTICNIENNRQQLSGTILRRVAKVLKVGVMTLWPEE